MKTTYRGGGRGEPQPWLKFRVQVFLLPIREKSDQKDFAPSLDFPVLSVTFGTHRIRIGAISLFSCGVLRALCMLRSEYCVLLVARGARCAALL
jgi:hypothetical protein